MNIEEITEKLSLKYPNSCVFQNKDSNGVIVEVVVELENDGNQSHAIAVIDRSLPHFHLVIEEKYKVIKGVLSLYVDERNIILHEGDEFKIEAGKKHYAIGDSTWVDVVATPAWNPEDHITLSVPFDTEYIPLTQQYYLCVPTCIQMIMLKNKIPLIPAEEIGKQLGLIVPETDKKYFWNVSVGTPHNSGYGTNINKYPLKDFFSSYDIPLECIFVPISTFKSTQELSAQILKLLNKESSVLVCYDWGSLFGDNKKHWGHVCLLDHFDKQFNLVRMIDPDPDQPKWKYVSLEDLFDAMKFHGDEKSGGLWKFKSNKVNQ